MVSMTKTLLALFLICFTSFTQAQDVTEEFVNQAAYDTVQQATDQLIEQITSKREIYLEDTEQFFADVDGLLSEVIDFKRIARRVMAKHYKKAEPDQQAEFVDVFKRSLLKVYAKALLEYNNEKIEILPPRTSTKVRPNRQRVDIEFFSNDGQMFPISYSMYLNKQGEWKMENVVVNGVNIGLTYRNQFARLMKVHGNDVDLVISGWTSDLEENAE